MTNNTSNLIIKNVCEALTAKIKKKKLTPFLPSV